MKVCIEKNPQGQYSVYQEPEESGAETAAMETAEVQDKQPARDLQDALMIAGKMLQQAQEANSPFDEGMKKVMPGRQPQMGM